MADQDKQLTYQELSVLELLKTHTQSQKDAIKTLENKAQQNFTIINIIAAIVAALNLELGDTAKVQQILIERPLLTLSLAGYAAIVFLSIRALVLRKQGTESMTVSLKNAKDWSTCELDHHYDILIQSYVQIYEHNEKIVAQKGSKVRWAHILIAVVIVLIGVEALGLWTQIVIVAEMAINLFPR